MSVYDESDHFMDVPSQVFAEMEEKLERAGVTTLQDGSYSGAEKLESQVKAVNLKGLYETEIDRSKNLWCKKENDGMLMPYTATTVVCGQCYPRIGPDNRHFPRCYQGSCRKCEKFPFGHMQFNCCQKDKK